MSSSSSSSASVFSCQSWQDIQDDDSITNPPNIPPTEAIQPTLGSVSRSGTLLCPGALFDGVALNHPQRSNDQHQSYTIESSSPSAIIQSSNFTDGNIEVNVGNHTFHLHQYKMREFNSLHALMNTGAPSMNNSNTSGRANITVEENVEDFRNMLNVLYSTAYGQFGVQFSSFILKSTLRVATNLDHPAMRAFAIDALEKENMEPIERIILARQSDIPAWEELGLEELCARERSLTVDEAQVLGIETFVELAARREARQSQQGLGLVLFKRILSDRHRHVPSQGSQSGSQDTSSETECDTQRPTSSHSSDTRRSALLQIIDTAFSNTTRSTTGAYND